MTNSIPVGGVRTYAYLDNDGPLTHERWRNAIKAGRTFTSTGPLMDFTVDGLPPGGSLTLANGGTVVGATALTGKLHSVKLALSQDTLATLRRKHGPELEEWWRARFGHAFDCLTESEARYLERTPNADRVRDRIAAEK
jgi:hypothetical protein